MLIKFAAITKQGIFWNFIYFPERVESLFSFSFPPRPISFCYFSEIVALIQKWEKTVSLWVQFECFFHFHPFPSREQMAWWEAFLHCLKKKG